MFRSEKYTSLFSSLLLFGLASFLFQCSTHLRNGANEKTLLNELVCEHFDNHAVIATLLPVYSYEDWQGIKRTKKIKYSENWAPAPSQDTVIFSLFRLIDYASKELISALELQECLDKYRLFDSGQYLFKLNNSKQNIEMVNDNCSLCYRVSEPIFFSNDQKVLITVDFLNGPGSQSHHYLFEKINTKWVERDKRMNWIQ